MNPKYLLLINIVLLCFSCSNNTNTSKHQTNTTTGHEVRKDTIQEQLKVSKKDTITVAQKSQNVAPEKDTVMLSLKNKATDSLKQKEALKIIHCGKVYYRRHIDDEPWVVGDTDQVLWYDSKTNALYDVTTGKDTYMDYGKFVARNAT